MRGRIINQGQPEHSAPQTETSHLVECRIGLAAQATLLFSRKTIRQKKRTYVFVLAEASTYPWRTSQRAMLEKFQTIGPSHRYSQASVRFLVLYISSGCSSRTYRSQFFACLMEVYWLKQTVIGQILPPHHEERRLASTTGSDSLSEIRYFALCDEAHKKWSSNKLGEDISAPMENGFTIRRDH